MTNASVSWPHATTLLDTRLRLSVRISIATDWYVAFLDGRLIPGHHTDWNSSQAMRIGMERTLHSCPLLEE